jgi:hypothetical protein
VFAVPGLTALGIGAAILTAALMHWFGLLRWVPFGESWIVVAALLVTVGQVSGLMAIASHLYGVREGYRLPKAWLHRFRKLLSLEGCVITGLVLIATSFVALAGVGVYWGDAGFAALPSVLPVTLAGLTGVVGLQTLFGGVLLAVLGGNEADFLKLTDANSWPR